MRLNTLVRKKGRTPKRLKRKLDKHAGQTTIHISNQVHFLLEVYGRQHDLSLRRAADQLIRIGFAYQQNVLPHEILSDSDTDD